MHTYSPFWLRLLLALGAALGIGTPVAAQVVDPIQDLLDGGRQAYNNLNFRAADSIAMVALERPELRRSHRLQALQLAAAARYPESAGDQYADSAMSALRRYVRIAPTAPIARDLTWRGLDSLLAEARRTTFGASVSVPGTTAIEGVNGRVSFPVAATRPAHFALRVWRQGDEGPGELVDSIGPLELGVLRMAPVVSDFPRFASGNYRLQIMATDPTTGEQLNHVLRGEFVTPPVPLVEVPEQVDPNALLPERSRPNRVGSLISGGLVGGLVIASARLLRPVALADASVKPESRSVPIGVGLAVLTTAASWYLDRGKLIAPNVDANLRLLREFTARRSALMTENERLRVAYRGEVRLAQEEW
ncbi:MAG: hypothetical protein SGI84_03290 [Gemmatimonadota bacterium]|nr:hypothetical protein [Gemmatimonadota bacterium]